MTLHKVLVPQLGVNDDFAVVYDFLASSYEHVSQGDILCTLETSKASSELEVIKSGYIRWFIEEGDEVQNSECIAIIADTPQELDLYEPEYQENFVDSTQATKPAKKLADKLGIDLDDIGHEGTITADDVRVYAQRKTNLPVIWPHGPDIMPVVIYGAGAGGEVVRRYLIQDRGYYPVFFIDDDKAAYSQVLPVFDKRTGMNLIEEHWRDVGLFIAIANGPTRIHLIDEFTETCEIINVTASNFYNSCMSSSIGIGNQFKNGAVIGPGCVIGDGCIIDNNVTISHDCDIRDGCHLAPGVTLGGSVTVGNYSILGIGVSVASDITIGRNCIVSPGTSVVTNIPDNSIVEGVPGKIIGVRR